MDWQLSVDSILSDLKENWFIITFLFSVLVFLLGYVFDLKKAVFLEMRKSRNEIIESVQKIECILGVLRRECFKN